MANIKIKADFTIKDGSEISFKSPCYTSAITGIIIYYPDTNGNEVSRVFQLVDAHNNDISNINNVFASNAIVKVILSVTNSRAYIQNADTNAYLEGRFSDIEDTIKYTHNAIGEYGKYEYGKSYNIPKFTVDSKGRITAAADITIPNAEEYITGLMPAAMYRYICEGKHLGFEVSKTWLTYNQDAVYEEDITDCGNCSWTFFDTESSEHITHYAPKIYNIYVYAYIDNSKSKRCWIPVTDYYFGYDDQTNPANCRVYIKFPEKYRDFNAGENIDYLTIYERDYEPPST